MRTLLFLVVLTALPSMASAGDGPLELRPAVERGLAIVQKAARSYPEHRECFSCHHQTLPLLAMRTAREGGFVIDGELLKTQMDFTRESLHSRIDSLKEGKNIGGRAMTVSYALWTWQIAEAPADDVTAAMVAYLLKTQEASGRWKPPSHRPPMEESQVTCTVLSAWMLDYYADETNREAATQAIDKAKAWLRTAELKHHEDTVFALWGKVLLKEPEVEREPLRKRLFDSQKPDGSWSQEPEMDGDAYATGQAIFALREAGLPASDTSIERGVQYLLKSQKPDGSWHVVTRSRPVQEFFDNGDPHGKDQFISIPATAWALAALARP